MKRNKNVCYYLPTFVSKLTFSKYFHRGILETTVLKLDLLKEHRDNSSSV